MEVRIEGCTSLPCIVKRGTDAIIEIDFESTSYITELTPSVRVTIFGITLSQPLPDELLIGCNHLIGHKCPIPPYRRTTYKVKFPIDANALTIRIRIELSLNAQDFVAACFWADVSVTRNNLLELQLE